MYLWYIILCLVLVIGIAQTYRLVTKGLERIQYFKNTGTETFANAPVPKDWAERRGVTVSVVSSGDSSSLFKDLKQLELSPKRFNVTKASTPEERRQQVLKLPGSRIALIIEGRARLKDPKTFQRKLETILRDVNTEDWKLLSLGTPSTKTKFNKKIPDKSISRSNRLDTLAYLVNTQAPGSERVYASNEPLFNSSTKHKHEPQSTDDTFTKCNETI